MSKFYKVIKENFLWDIGAILQRKKYEDEKCRSDGYSSIDHIYNKHEEHSNEYISSSVVENSPEYFERVYPVNLVTKTVYKIKEEAKTMLARGYS